MPKPKPKPKPDRREMVTVGIRSPAEVIALALQDAGVPDPGTVAADAAARLARTLDGVTRPGARVIIVSEGGDLEWATSHGAEGE